MLILPLSDDNPTLHRPYVTWGLLGACCLVFLWQIGFGTEAFDNGVKALGVVPSRFFGLDDAPHFDTQMPALLTPFSSMFMHGGMMHLIGNMLFLYIFGDNIEDAMGRGRFLLFYLICGYVAALTQAFVFPHSTIPMIGASGAIAGVLGAYLIIFPRANMRVLVLFLIINVPAFLMLGFWIGMQFLNLGQLSGDKGGVAYLAHIGGFVAGLVLAPFFKKPYVALFQKPHSRAFAAHRLRLARHVPLTQSAPPRPAAQARPGQRHPWDD